MSFIITNHRVNGYELGKEYSTKPISNQNLFFEFDRKFPKKLITVSAKNLSEFYLNDEKITFDNFKEFIKKHQDNVLVENSPTYTSYIFKEHCLAFYILNDDCLFSQVLIYDKSLKSEYESNLQPIKNNQNNAKISIFQNQLIFEPYNCFDELLFGMSVDEFIKILNNVGYHIDDKNTRMLIVDNIFFSFRENKLSEIFFDKNNNNKKIEIFIQNHCITNKQELLNIQKEHLYFKRRDGRMVFQELGFSVNECGQEYHFFGKKLLPFWTNPHRPITSW